LEHNPEEEDFIMTPHKGSRGTLQLAAQATRFAKAISGRSDLDGCEIPDDLWRSLGRREMLGWGVPTAYGGTGARFAEILPAVDAFVAQGGPPGIALSWMLHLIVGKVLIADAGTLSQKKEILSAMAQGKWTASIALSEPGSGSDPRRIRTTAVKEKDSYVLNGEKAWLTNGPMADAFIVFAVTGERAGKKALTAFLVLRGTPGLTVREMPPLDFLRPSPHCAIRLEACVVPETAVVGRKGRAWEDLSKPFRVAEDTLLAGAILGGLRRELGQAGVSWRQNRRDVGPHTLEGLGAAAALLDAAERLACDAARDLDAGNRESIVERRLAAMQLIAQTVGESIGGVLAGLGIEKQTGSGTLGNDITRLLGIGMHASRARQRKWGEKLLSGKERT
jgi:acyl-CoA dehydrogenase